MLFHIGAKTNILLLTHDHIGPPLPFMVTHSARTKSLQLPQYTGVEALVSDMPGNNRSKRPTTQAASAAEPAHARNKRPRTVTDEAETRVPTQEAMPWDEVDMPPSDHVPQITAAADVATVAAVAADVAVDRIMQKLAEAGLLKPAAEPRAQPGTSSTQNQLAGELVNAMTYGSPEQPGQSHQASLGAHAHLVATPLGFHVDPTVKAKIWGDCYVPYNSLLTPTNDKQFTQQTEQFNRPNPIHDKQPLTIDNWLTAHNTYMYIYLEKHPHMAQQLIKYTEIVRDLAKRCGQSAFTYYDQTFRSLRQDHPELRFDVPHQEIWMRASSFKTLSPQMQPFRGKKSISVRAIPEGYCFNYNTPDTHCTTPQCTYKHRCTHCDQPHPRFRCTFSTQNKQPTTKPTANTNKSKQA